jgi:hypothetical protein
MIKKKSWLDLAGLPVNVVLIGPNARELAERQARASVQFVFSLVNQVSV